MYYSMIFKIANKMLNISLRKKCYLTLNRYVIVLSKLSYSDSSVVKVNAPFRIKEYGGDFVKNNTKKTFEKCFVEELFINNFQPKVLEYPQLSNLKQVKSLKQQCYIVQQLLGNTNNETKVLSESDSTNSVNTLRTYELTGFRLPRSEQGFGYVNSEFSLMQEALGVSPSLSKSASENDDFGTNLISTYGSETQKEKYLKRLGTGEIITSVAHVESEPFALLDPDLVTATAELSSDKQSYIISAEKKWVYNAKHADIFILSANITTENSDGVKEGKPTLFIVPKDTPGIKFHEPINIRALKHLDISDVTFDKVVVPLSSVLGSVQAGGTILRNILSKGKLSNGAHCLPIMRELVNKAIKHCLHAEFFKKSKYECDYFKIKIGEMVSQVYAVESMTYLLTGRLDEFQNPDLFLESIIIKIFASESLQSILNTCIELIGREIITSDTDWKQIINDSQFYTAAEITNDHLRLVLGLTGVQYAMDHRKKRNIIERKVSDTVNSIINLFRDRDYTCIAQGVLHGYLHCIFALESKALEDGVQWLYESTDNLIKSYGENVFNMHQDLKSLADMAIYIYAETAVLARASRAYCLGVKLSEVDHYTASALVKKFHYRINKLGRLLKYRNQRPNIDQVQKNILNCNNYFERQSIFQNLMIKN